MACDCITKLEATMPEHKLEIAFMLRGGDLTTETCTNLLRRDNGRRESRSGKPKIFAHSFCPFCGVSYSSEAGNGAS